MSQFLLSLWFSFMVFSTTAWGDPVYKWIDNEGVIHYGQHPPVAEDAIEAKKLNMISADPAQHQSAQQELQRVIALAQKLEADRQAREQQAREERLLALRAAYYEGLLEEQKAPPPPVAEHSDRIIWGTPYHGYYPRHQYRDYVRRRHYPRAGLHISIGRPYPYKDHKDRHHHRRHKLKRGDNGHQRSTRSIPGRASSSFAPRPQGLSAAPKRE